MSEPAHESWKDFENWSVFEGSIIDAVGGVVSTPPPHADVEIGTSHTPRPCVAARRTSFDVHGDPIARSKTAAFGSPDPYGVQLVPESVDS